MDDTSPSQKVKLRQCDSCKRVLPLNRSYGVLRSSRSGYNPTCRECRRYLRKQTYYKGGYSGTIYPLKAKNRQVLKNPEMNRVSGTALDTQATFTVELDFKPFLMKMALINEQGEAENTYYCFTDQEDEFLEFVVDFLTKKKIRLYDDPDDFLI